MDQQLDRKELRNNLLGKQLNKMSARDFLKENELVNCILKQPQLFTKELLRCPRIINGLIDIALRPIFYQQCHSIILTIQETNNAFQLLSRQDYDLFSEYLIGQQFSKTKDKKNNQKTKFKQKNQGRVPLDYAFQMLKTSSIIEETQGYYLCGVITSVCYKRTVELNDYLIHRQHIITHLCKHIYCRSISELLMLLLETSHEEHAFTEQKAHILNKILETLPNIKKAMLMDAIDNTSHILNFMSGKLEDRYGKKSQTQIWSIFFSNINFDSILSLYWPHTEYSLPILCFICSVLQVDDNSKMLDNKEINLNPQMKIPILIIDSICEFLKTSIKSTLALNSTKVLLQMYSIIYYMQAIALSKVTTIITNEIIKITLKNMFSHPNSSLLHYKISRVLITHLQVTHQLKPYLHSRRFKQAVDNISAQNETNSLGITIFRITKCILEQANKMGKNPFQNIDNISKKQVFLNTKICQQANLKWDFFQSINKSKENEDLMGTKMLFNTKIPEQAQENQEQIQKSNDKHGESVTNQQKKGKKNEKKIKNPIIKQVTRNE